MAMDGTQLMPTNRSPSANPKQACKGKCMNRELIWIDGDDFTGWSCSRCTWGMTTPCLDSTVAALAFNRVAQQDFERHSCVHNAQGDA
jgi:hypothetical protein